MTKKVAKKAKKPISKKVSGPRTARQVLNIIDKFLVGGVRDARLESEAKKLWDVLAALRGPDDDSVGNKDNTTCPIRCAAFPLTAKQYQDGYCIPGGAMFTDRSYRGPKKYAFDKHFQNHAVAAALALNLI